MGRYTTRPLEDGEIRDLIDIIASGYTDNDGIPHKPNKQVATILVLQANLGCRIGDICALTVESFSFDGNAWRLDIKEQKTGKARLFVVPGPVKRFIDKWIAENGIKAGRLFSISEYAVWKQLRAATAVLGMENVSCHSLRKFAALRLYNASGKDIALTSAFLNHSDTKTTLLYLKRSTKQMDEVLSNSTILF